MLMWIDFTCPFSFISIKRIFSLIEENNLELNLELKAFLMNPNIKGRQNYLENLKTKYNISEKSAKDLTYNVEKLAGEENLNLDFAKLNEVNTKNAHKIVKYFEKDEKYKDLIIKIFEEYFLNHKNINSIAVLEDILENLNLDSKKVKYIVEEVDDKEIEKDMYQASTFKIENTPTILLHNGKKYIGSRTKEEFLNIINYNLKMEIE